jgi:hypothetical protein
MRCEQCGRTGFTQHELEAHAKDQQHNPGPSYQSREEFARTPTPRMDAESRRQFDALQAQIIELQKQVAAQAGKKGGASGGASTVPGA